MALGLAVSLSLPGRVSAQEAPNEEAVEAHGEATAPQAEPTQAEPTQAEPTQAEPTQAEPTQAEPAAPEVEVPTPPTEPTEVPPAPHQQAAEELSHPSPLRLNVDAEHPPGFEPAPARRTAPPDTRPRDWRYSRRRTLRPLTLPQGAMRMDNTKSGTYLGRGLGSVQFSVAAGLHDDFEIGGTPLGLSMGGFSLSPHDPEAYARVRAISGPIQLAFRSNVVFPLIANNTQWGLTAELAWTAEDWLRVDTALDYQMLFDQPFQQRVGIPLAVTMQGGINAVTLTTGFYVFNDFDDVDLPLLLRYSVAFGGHQGPVTEIGMEGGFLDVIPNPDVSWTLRATVTWFAYIGR